MIIFAIV